MPFLKPCYNLHMRIHATSKELKKKAFSVKCQNMKQAVSMEVTFILVNKHQKTFFIKILPCLGNYASILSLC